MKSHRLAAVVAVLAVSATVSCSSRTSTSDSATAAVSTPTPAGDLAVTAFQEASDPTSLIDKAKGVATTIGVDGVTITEDGSALNPPDDTVDPQRATAQADGLKAELLISNFSNALNDFSEPVAYRMLSSPDHRATVVTALASLVKDNGWDGINVDLESLHERDTDGLISFLQELKAALPSDAVVSICLMAATTAQDYADIGYDLSAIGAAADRVMVMTYDQHGPWEDEPGPIGALSWQTAAIKALGQTIPYDKLDLGVAGYGYVWADKGNDMVSVAQARSETQGTAKWDDAAGEWTATRSDGSVLWWSDSRSYALRVALATQLGLHGIGLWVLGKTDHLG